MTTATPSKLKRTLFGTFFWLFNLSLFLILLVGFFPFMGMAILRDAATGEVPFSILIPTLGLVGVPTTSTMLGLQRQRQVKRLNALLQLEIPEPDAVRPPITLFQLCLGIEAPLLMGCTIRLFFLRDLTPASSFLFVSLGVGAVAFIHWLLYQHRSESKPADWFQLAGLTIILVLSLYLVAIALFYVLPILVATGFLLAAGLFMVIIIPILFPFIMLFSGLVAMPWGMAVLFTRTWRQSFRRLKQRHGRWAQVWVATVLALWLGLLILLQQQPQTQAFALLAQSPQTDRDRTALLQQSTTIRNGLLNAYLSGYRYPLRDDRTLQDLYRGILDVPEPTAAGIQAAYNSLLTPFAYHGDSQDKQKAAQLYAEFFDAPILRGEHQAIQTAVLSNFNRTEAKAGLLDINAERVKLQQQDITVTPEGDWAEIELHEVYANTTFDNTEILYYFSLPESATITGLWLGETGDLSDRYEYTVSPRGAAQQVYTDQVRRSVDPALLEQVGPRNYRLRAFPIPPVGQDSLPQDGQPDRMHLWLTYKVMQQDGQWMLPVLNERRNIFWRKNTTRTLNGKRQPGSQDWLPPSIPADSQQTQRFQAKLPPGYVVAQALTPQSYQQPQDQRLALILDRTYSMNAHRAEVQQSLDRLKTEILPTNQVDLYLTSDGSHPAERVADVATFDLKDTVFFGRLQPRQMLAQFQRTLDSTAPPYDAIILVTDAGNYELSGDAPSLDLPAPLWLVHLGGLPAAYDDATLETIQKTGGNTADHLETVLQRIATRPSLDEDSQLLDVVDGYAWFLNPTPITTAVTSEKLTPLAARQWITQVSEGLQPTQIDQLDTIHAIAKTNSIVTPYSSMLVLVNPEQKRQLKAAEARSDRFQREVEDPQLPDPQNNANLAPVSAVPEPGEGLLLGAGVIVLAVGQYLRQLWES